LNHFHFFLDPCQFESANSTLHLNCFFTSNREKLKNIRKNMKKHWLINYFDRF
jgi:hypothetical protein